MQMQSLTSGRSLVNVFYTSFQREVRGSVAASEGIECVPIESIYSARAMHVGCTCSKLDSIEHLLL